MICRNDSYREDLTRSHVPLFQAFMRLGPQEWQPPLLDQSSIELRESFMRYVQEFAKRKLSFDSDTLNAFAGVINWFRTEVELGSTFGLPNHTFGLDLLWNPEEYLRRRSGFPSWSWAGWEGNLRMSKSGVPIQRGPTRIRTHFSAKQAWLAGLYFLAFYVYQEDKNVFELVSDNVLESGNDPKGHDHNSITAKTQDLQLQGFPRMDLSRDLTFDPRGKDLESLCTLFQKFASSAPSRVEPNHLAPLRSFDLNNRALYFRTVVARVSASIFGPDDLEQKQLKPKDRGNSFEDTTYPSSHYIYLSDDNGKFLGLAWLHEEDAHERLRRLCRNGVAQGKTKGELIEVAVVSGPILGNWRTRSTQQDIDMGIILRASQSMSDQFSTGKSIRCAVPTTISH